MGDLLNDLARTRPPTPEVDHDRMERDLARITALPRPGRRAWASSFGRRFGPVLVAVAAVVLLVLAVLPSDRAEPIANLGTWWHVQTRYTTLWQVGDPANPYLMRHAYDSDEWVAPGRQVTVTQLNGLISPRSAEDATKYEAAGKPNPVPVVGMKWSLRVGPLRPAASSEPYMPILENVPFEAIAGLPTDVEELRKIVNHPSHGFSLASSPLRTDQRHALFALLKTMTRDLGKVTLPDGRTGLGVAIAPVESFWTGNYEEQLIVDEQTAEPIVIRHVLVAPWSNLPAGTVVTSTEFVHLGMTRGAEGPPDVERIGKGEDPIVKR
jgi:hypothetical protein